MADAFSPIAHDTVSPNRAQAECVPLFRVQNHWELARDFDDAAIVYSDLPRGDSPVALRARAINFVLDGTEQYEIDGRAHAVGPGEFLLVDAGVTARLITPRRERVRGLGIYLPPPDGETRENAGEDAPFEVRAFHLTERGTALGKAIAGVIEGLGNGADLGSHDRAALVASAEREFDAWNGRLVREAATLKAARPATRRDILNRVHQARAFLHDHVAENIPLMRLATVAGMSQFHFARSFRAIIGCPPSTYHARLKMTAALRALQSGHMSIAEVAIAYGFSEPSSFTRAFRAAWGISPGQAARGGVIDRLHDASE